MPLELLAQDSVIKRLQAAIALALRAHGEQVDKGGEPYIFHVLSVGFSLLPDVDAAVLGILHDVREDSDATEEEIRAVLGAGQQHLYPYLETLTHDRSQPYLEYVKDCAAHPLTRKVKLADILHNLDSRRLRLVESKGFDRYALLAKYLPARVILEEAGARRTLNKTSLSSIDPRIITLVCRVRLFSCACPSQCEMVSYGSRAWGDP